VSQWIRMVKTRVEWRQ